jgi:hypothetical protein
LLAFNKTNVEGYLAAENLIGCLVIKNLFIGVAYLADIFNSVNERSLSVGHLEVTTTDANRKLRYFLSKWFIGGCDMSVAISRIATQFVAIS